MTTTSGRRRRRALAAIALIVAGLGGIVGTGTPAAADVDSVQGSATALSIGGTPATPTVSGAASEGAGTDTFGPTGSGVLPSGTACPSGAVAPGVTLPVVLSLGLLENCTRGGGVIGENHLAFAESSAAVADVVVGGTVIGVIRSSCRADGNGAVGSSQIVGTGIQTLLGLPPTATLPTGLVPTIVPTLSLEVNRQEIVNVAGTARIRVTALRLVLAGIDIRLAESFCEALGPNVNTTTIPPTTAPPTTAPPTTTPPTTTPPTTTGPGVTTTVAPGGNNNNNNNNSNVNPNDNTNTNPNTNTNTNNNTVGGNNIDIGGTTINITSPPAQVVILDQHQRQIQTQSQTSGGVLAKTGSTLQPLGVLSVLSLVLGLLLLVGSSMTPVRAGAYAGANVPEKWGPVEIGRTIWAGGAALVLSAVSLVRRRKP